VLAVMNVDRPLVARLAEERGLAKEWSQLLG
jgi:hypothetical protein